MSTTALCEEGLRPIREYMELNKEPLTTAAKTLIRDMASAAYQVCSVEEFRSFADSELMPWAERVGDDAVE